MKAVGKGPHVQEEKLPSNRVLIWRLLVALGVLVAVFALALNRDEAYESRSERNREFGIVRATLDGHHYNIPVRYMYSAGFEEKGYFKYWPEPKKERIQVAYLRVMLLLPELRPYYVEDDARWKMLGYSDKLFIDLGQQGSEGWLKWNLDYVREASPAGFYKQIPDEMGFLTFKTQDGTEYFSRKKDFVFKMTCRDPRSAPSPSCQVKSNYKYGFALEYSFSSKYKDRWKAIDEGLKQLFDEFEQAGEAAAKADFETTVASSRK